MNVSFTSQSDPAYSTWKNMPATMWGALFSRFQEHAITDAQGNFTLTHVPEGTYLLAASKFAEGDVAYLDDVAVRDGETTDGVVLRLQGTGSARVTVLEDGVPVPDLKVSLSRNIGFNGMDTNAAVTDGLGTALFSEVRAGTWYVITARDEGNWDTDSSRRRLVIVEGQTVEKTIELRPRDGVRVHGRLTMNGKHVFNDVMLIGTGNRAEAMKNTSTVEGGFYEFVGVKPGTYELHARTSDTTITAFVRLELEKEGDFPFDKDFAGYAVRGSVTTPDNKPAQLAAVSVALQHADSARPEFAGWLRGRATADATGAFSITDVSPGRYILSASLDGVGSVSTTITVAGTDLGGLKLEIARNTGSIKFSVGKLTGTPVSGNGFGFVTLTRPDGTPVDLGETFQGWFMVREGTTQTLPNVPEGTYTLEVQGSGYMPVQVKDVSVTSGEVTSLERDFVAACELHITFTNTEITQQLLDGATVKYFNAGGVQVARPTNLFDAWGDTEAPESPTLMAKYIGQDVTEVRVKVTGYSELVISVEPEPGKKIARQESAVAE
jgi:hypothetical protein